MILPLLCMYFVVPSMQETQDVLMNQHQKKEMRHLPGLLKGLQGGWLQLRVKMEPTDYLWVSIIVATLILSSTENWELAMSHC